MPKPLNQKIEEGNARTEAWRALSPARQLAELDRRLGPGVGARRQRARLERLIALAQPTSQQTQAVADTVHDEAVAVPARVFASKAEERRFAAFAREQRKKGK
jgi:hypothetical protein